MLVTLAAMLGQIGLPGGGFGFSLPLRQRRRAVGRRAGADRHHRRRQGQGRRRVDDGERRGVDPGRARRRDAAQPGQGVRLQRSQGQVSRRQDGLLGRRQSVRPPPGPQPHGRGVEEARDLHRPRLPVDADRALRRHRAAGDDHLRAQRHRQRRRLLGDGDPGDEEGDRSGVREPHRLRHLRRDLRAPRQGQGVHRRQERDGLDQVVLRRGADPGQGEEDRHAGVRRVLERRRAWSSSPSPAARASFATPSFREDPLLNPLGTPSGKFEIYSKNIEKMGYDDCGPHPTVVRADRAARRTDDQV